jgi:iron complex outermembrane recepter protein
MMKSIFTLFLFCIIAISGYGQTTLKGKVVDSKTNEPLIGATILIKGTTSGISTSLDGDFSFVTDATGTQKAIVSSMGYTAKEIDITLKGGETDLGNIALENGAVGLHEVNIIASVAIDRKTPVAVSTINRNYIEDKLGNQEFPQILKQTPGIYATNQGGAFGDSRINARGFDTRNMAVMINGVPVNDMENGTVYWSNWAGLSDVSRSMQVQRGLGASKLAVPSVGGTINVLTNTTETEKGGSVTTTVGNDNMIKYGITLSTGLSKNNWASTISLSKNTGNGYADATQYEAYSYFFNLSKRINDKHTLALTVFGAPQWHNQRSYAIAFSQFEKYNSIRYNDQWGYRNGQQFNVKKNYFHKPQAILNHFWTINENTSVNTAVYASIGNGGGTGAAVTIADRTNDGLLNIDKVVNTNIANGLLGSSNIIKSSRNDHVWYGVISTIQHTIGHLSLTGGIDARGYRGKHYQTVDDLLGGQFYIDKNTTSSGDVNNPNKVARLGDEVGYHNDGLVRWYGGFVQAEYTLSDKLTVTAVGALSDKWYQRIDYNRYFSDEMRTQLLNDATLQQQYTSLLTKSVYDQAWTSTQKSQTADILGYNVRGGANYNITATQNIFFNTGYIERQPDFNNVYPNNLNLKNGKVKNEKIFGLELGYGFRSRYLTANVNVYNTGWNDKTVVIPTTQADGTIYYANLSGVDALHKGIEFDFVTQPFERLKINGSVSLEDNRWKDVADSVKTYDENQNPVGTPFKLYLKDVHVGNSAQSLFALGTDYNLMKGLWIGVNYNYFDRLYGNFVPENRKTNMGDAWKMPAYGLVDMNIKYDFALGETKATMFINAYNILNTRYFSEGTDADMSKPDAKLNALVWYGLGTTWSVGLKIRF